LVFNLDAETLVDDPVLWRKKRQQFLKLLGRYQERFGFDPARVYLTGFSFSGVYAWMLAYDRPDLYAGVVAMSAVWYPEQIQQKLKSAESVVTVVVGGEKDAWLVRDLAQAKKIGRIIESRNPHSRFVVKPGEDHGQVAKHWVTCLKYVLQCSRSSTAAPAPIRPSRKEH
jgi:dienelactone hydrolase